MQLETATSFPTIVSLCLSGLPVVIGRVSRDVIELQDSLQVRHQPRSFARLTAEAVSWSSRDMRSYKRPLKQRQFRQAVSDDAGFST
jgi:hypothetical protein